MAARLVAVERAVRTACERAGRSPGDVRIVGVTKGHGVEAVRAAAAAGLRDLGENFVQELERKREETDAEADAATVRWHFLGRVQSNKARRVAVAADVVHGLEPGRGAARLGAATRERGETLPCLIEVDFTGSRQGVPPEDLPRALEELAGTPGIALRGLMTVPPMTPQPEDARPYFTRLRELRERHAPELPELSMGMSADFPVAIEEGATMIRIGTALFGDRPT